MENRHIEVFGKKRGQGDREYAEHLKNLAEYLPDRDRALVTLVYEQGVKPADIAAASGVNAQHLYSRLTRIGKRVNNPAVRVMLQVQDMIPPDARELCREHFLERVSAPNLAKKHDYPTHWVYQVLKKYRRYFEQQANPKQVVH